ncbi:multiple inositol polyphosphate phosphatase 1-like [Ruditapes philippinarum]|uniref:multiple inositol polyphosphate phosphatase 1-like n=1 Tax=Ruditapes philippinarum TaxID=129788 RepID=UPI00295C009B|nr:multiple inositol polyphosphate phosphatase 1-like [Ruditapes philippinarum]
MFQCKLRPNLSFANVSGNIKLTVVLVMALVNTVCVVVSIGLIKLSLGDVFSYTNMGYGNNQYGIKTAYFWTHPGKGLVKNRLMQITIGGRTCNAVHVNVVARHGARYTGLKDMRSFTFLQRKLKNNFSNQNYNFINDWVNNYPEEKAEQLTALGRREMAYLGKYFGTELFDLLKGTLGVDGTPKFLNFTATHKVRTQNSVKFLYSGLADILVGQNSTNINPKIRDDILRFYDNCKKYEHDIADRSEILKFENGPKFQKMLGDITKRLGANVSLSIGDAKVLYVLCATELAIMNKADWCTLLTEDDREVLEYDKDIEEYLIKLYAHPVVGQMSCPLAKAAFTDMDSAIAANDLGSSYTKGIFQVGHTDTVVDLATGLGLFKDADAIRAGNYEAMKNRTFRASTHDTFSSHLAFILYNCGGSGADNYALKLVYNGKPVTIPKCNSETCWYRDFRLGYKHFIDDCDWNKVCSVNDGQPIVG